MRALLALFVLLVFYGCGHKHSRGPFADVAGHYQGTVTSVTGVYTSQYAPGHVITFTINDGGVISTTDSTGSPITYQLVRTTSDFTTQHRDLGGGDYEVGSAPFSLATVDMAVWSSAGSVLGTEALAVVKTAGG